MIAVNILNIVSDHNAKRRGRSILPDVLGQIAGRTREDTLEKGTAFATLNVLIFPNLVRVEELVEFSSMVTPCL